MNTASDFNHYLTHLSAALGHAGRHAGLSGYFTGLMLPLSRKSVDPMAAKPYSGMGRPSVMPRRTAVRQPMSVKALALALPDSAFHTISWREGSNARLTGRFAALRVRCAGSNVGKARLLPEQWLLIEWLADQAEPEKYYLSTLPETAAINDLVAAAHMRWRIERDYQDLKQNLGLGHYEGRGWTGFHHHASLSIAAYGYLMALRLRTGKDVGGKKNTIQRQIPAVSQDYIPRGRPAHATACAQLNHNALPSTGRIADRRPRTLPTL